MKRIALCVLVLAAQVGQLSADDKLVRAKVREVSWTVEVRDAEGQAVSRGSATLIVDSKGRSWALGCQHVVRRLTDGGSVVLYRTAEEDGEKVGKTELACELARSSEKEDLSLLRVKKNKAGPSAAFGEEKALPLDEPLWHCGTFHGEYERSVSKGVLAGRGYKIRPTALACDQADFKVERGSSGGGVFDGEGRLVGVVVWMHGSSCSFFVPNKRVRPWLKSVGAAFLYDPKAAVPDELPPPPKEEKKSEPLIIRPVGPFGGAASDSEKAVVPAPARERKQEAVWLAGDGRGGR